MNRPKVYMNEAEGMVQEARNNKALVITDRQAMCGQCTAKSFCGMFGSGEGMLAEALNPIGAKAGDTVKIGVPTGTVAKASMIVYAIPTIGIVGGAALGYYIGKSYGLDVNLSTLIGSLAGIALSMISVRLLSNILCKKSSYQPEIIKIIKSTTIG